MAFDEADLQYSVANVPTSQAGCGRPTNMLLSSSGRSLYVSEKWTDAKPLLDDIIASNKYTLMPSFTDNFVAAKRNNAESVLKFHTV